MLAGRFLLLVFSVSLVAQAARITPDKLSPQVKTIYDKILERLGDKPDSYSPTPKDLILTSGHLVAQLAHYGDTDQFAKHVFFERLANAQTEVLVSTMIFDRALKPTPKGVVDALVELNKRAKKRGKKVRFYFVYDPVGTAFFVKEKIHARNIVSKRHNVKHPEKLGFPKYADLDFIDFKVKEFHGGVLGALHSKMMLIDGTDSIIGSKNLDGDTSFEYMTVLRGAITASLRADFERIWDEPIEPCPTLITDYDASKDVPMLVVSRKDESSVTSHSTRAPQDTAWLTAMDVAKEEVYIQTPNFCEARITKKVLETVRRGTPVIINTSIRQQDVLEAANPFSASSNSGTMKKLFESLHKDTPEVKNKLKWCWFIGKRAGPNAKATKTEWSHVKFMTVDNRFVMLGSGNQDPQSWYNSREVNVLIDDPKTAVAMKDELLAKQQTLSHCYQGDYNSKWQV